MYQALKLLKIQRGKTEFIRFTPFLKPNFHNLLNLKTMTDLKFFLDFEQSRLLKEFAEVFFKVVHAAYLLYWLFELISEKMLLHQF